MTTTTTTDRVRRLEELPTLQAVDGRIDLFVGGKHVYTIYADGKEVGHPQRFVEAVNLAIRAALAPDPSEEAAPEKGEVRVAVGGTIPIGLEHCACGDPYLYRVDKCERPTSKFCQNQHCKFWLKEIPIATAPPPPPSAPAAEPTCGHCGRTFGEHHGWQPSQSSTPSPASPPTCVGCDKSPAVCIGTLSEEPACAACCGEHKDGLCKPIPPASEVASPSGEIPCDHAGIGPRPCLECALTALSSLRRDQEKRFEKYKQRHDEAIVYLEDKTTKLEAALEAERQRAEKAECDKENQARIILCLKQDLKAAEAEASSLRQERDRLRETNTRLSRRAQSAESGLAAKLDSPLEEGRTLGRALANSAATMYKAALETAEFTIAEKERQLQEAQARIGTIQRETVEQFRNYPAPIMEDWIGKWLRGEPEAKGDWQLMLDDRVSRAIAETWDKAIGAFCMDCQAGRQATWVPLMQRWMHQDKIGCLITCDSSVLHQARADSKDAVHAR